MTHAPTHARRPRTLMIGGDPGLRTWLAAYVDHHRYRGTAVSFGDEGLRALSEDVDRDTTEAARRTA